MKERHQGIELLRIVSMIMVLGLHANFMALGKPEDSILLSSEGVIRVLLQSLCVVAVDVFVMISGYFGIRPSLKGFCNFMWQVIFFVSVEFLVAIIFFNENFTTKDLFSIFGLFGGGGWFVASYIGLYILSPVLNAFLAKSTDRQIISVIIAFIAFEVLWGDTLSVSFIVGGYSTFSFIGIYLLAGLLKKLQLNTSCGKLWTIFLSTALLNTSLFIISSIFNIFSIRDVVLNYINPLTICGACCLILIFSFKDFTTFNSAVLKFLAKYIAPSCFAAYLFHVGTPFTSSLYRKFVEQIFINTSYFFSFIAICAFILFVFASSIIFDIPRRFIWNKCLSPLFK